MADKGDDAADDVDIGFVLDDVSAADMGAVIVAVLPRLADGLFHMLDDDSHIQGAVARLTAHGFGPCAESAFEALMTGAEARTLLRSWGWREFDSMDDAEIVQGE